MGDVFLSFRGRVLINAEALNMAESVGNYVKHRRIPVVAPETYTTLFVPSVSGEAIAHGYQQVLAQVAKSMGLPVCRLCEKGIFLKSSNNDIFKAAFGKDPPADEFEFEKEVISSCVVEDIGGFLYAPARGGRQDKRKRQEERGQVKRTSNFYTGYMVPTADALRGAMIEPQMHTRYALGTEFVRRGQGEEGQQAGQMLYYVELASALYTFSFDLDTRFIGRATFKVDRVGEQIAKDAHQRKVAALEAFARFMIEMMFGAKKTRFLPVVDWESAVVAVSDDVWTVPSPMTRNYIERAQSKLKLVSYNTKLFVYDSTKGGSLEETLLNAVEEAKRRIKG